MTHLGKYRLEGEIGRGSSGIVYRAFDPGVSRTVAIKFLPEEDKSQLVRFNHKANASGRLNHKNIVSIFEYVANGDMPYLVMEYLDGENLDEIISSGRDLSILDKALIMSQVADGLCHAHNNGVVHCDVKPANIRILPNGTVKILDFGFASASEERSSQLAREGTLLGTVAYMAPEIFQDADFDKLCDVYSFGVVYFELITGKNPFGSDRDEIARVIYNILSSDALNARGLNPECPQKLDQLISRAMLQDRGTRYQSFEDLIVDQTPILSELQVIEVDALLQKAEMFLASEDTGQAKAIVIQALKLTPGSIPARTLLGKIDLKAQAQERRQKVLQLMESGRQELNGLEFASALRIFEKVIDFEPDHKEAGELILRAKVELDKLEQHKMLLAQSRQKLNAGEITEAYKCVLESLHDFPDDPSASALLDQIQNAITEREHRHRLEESLAIAKELVAAGALEESLTRLAEIEHSPQSAAMKPQILEVRIAIEEARQRIRLKSGLDEAHSLLTEGRWSEGLSCLGELEVEFPGNNEIPGLVSHAKKQLRIEEAAAYIKRLVSEVNIANATFDFDHAKDLIRKGLEIYAGNDELIAILAQTEHLQLAHRKRTTIDAATERASILASQNEFSAAIAKIDSIAETWNTDELNSLRIDIEGRRVEYERKYAIDMICENVREYQSRNLFQDAVSVGQQGLTLYPGEPSLQALVAVSQKSLEDYQRKQRVGSIHENARSCAAMGDFDSALKMVRDAMRELEEPSFEALCTEIEADRQKWNRREAAAASAASIEKLIQKSKFEDAISAGRKALTEFPGETELVNLIAEAEQSLAKQQRLSQVAVVEEKSNLLVKQRDFEAAICLLRDSIAELGSEPKLETLLTSTKGLLEEKMKSATIQSALARARKLMGSKQLSEAVELLQEALTKYPGNNLLEALLNEAGALLTARQEAEATEAAIREGRKALKRGDFKTAMELTTRRNSEGSKDPRLAVLEAEIKRAMDQEEKDRVSRAVLENVQGFENQGRFREGVEVLEQALLRDPSASLIDSRLQRLREKITRQEKVNETLDQACALIAGGMFDEALRFVTSSIEQYPDELAYPSLLDEIKRSQRADACAKACKEIAALRGKGNLDDALASADKAIAEFLDEPTIEILKADIEADIAEKIQIERIEGIASEARQLLSNGKADDAILLLEEAQQKHPGDQGLVALLAKSRGIVSDRKRTLESDELVQTFKALIQDGHVREALKGLKNALVQYPNEDRLQSLLAEITIPAATDVRNETERPISNRRVAGTAPRTSIPLYLAIAAVLALAVYFLLIRHPSPTVPPKIADFDAAPPIAVPVGEVKSDTAPSIPPVATTGATVVPSKSAPVGPPTVIPNPPPPDAPTLVQESIAWSKVNQQSRSDLKKFLADYPNGTNAPEAAKQFKRLEDSSRNIENAIERQKTDEEAIKTTIAAYVKAMNRHNAAEILNVYPNKDKAELEANLKEQKEDNDFQMNYDRPSFPQKDFAEVSGTQLHTIKTARGPSVVTKKFKAKLRNNGSNWMIDSITYGP